MAKKLAAALCSLVLVALANPIHFAEAASAMPVKEWTFLIFLNGNNNLDSYGAFNINQMEKVGSNDKVNVVVQWASLKNKKTVRLLVQKDSNPNKVTSPIVQDLGKADMGDWRNLKSFIEWGAQNYPAKHLFVNVWDHGSGWHAMKLRAQGNNTIRPTDISWDDNTGNHITTPQLGQALNEAAQSLGRKIDIYGSDACLMAMAEVAGEMKNSVNYFVGSQELEPGAGWPYDDIMKAWNALPELTPAEVAKAVAVEYKKSYQGGQNGRDEVTQSAYDLTKSDEFYASVSALGQRLAALDKPSRAAVVKAASTAQNFFYDDYADLVDFLDQMEKAKLTTMIGADIVARVRTATQQYVIANEVTKSYARAHGVSMWIPSSKSTYSNHIDYYNQLAFQADTGWANALATLLQDGANVESRVIAQAQ